MRGAHAHIHIYAYDLRAPAQGECEWRCRVGFAYAYTQVWAEELAGSSRTKLLLRSQARLRRGSSMLDDEVQRKRNSSARSRSCGPRSCFQFSSSNLHPMTRDGRCILAKCVLASIHISERGKASATQSPPPSLPGSPSHQWWTGGPGPGVRLWGGEREWTSPIHTCTVKGRRPSCKVWLCMYVWELYRRWLRSQDRLRRESTVAVRRQSQQLYLRSTRGSALALRVYVCAWI